VICGLMLVVHHRHRRHTSRPCSNHLRVRPVRERNVGSSNVREAPEPTCARDDRDALRDPPRRTHASDDGHIVPRILGQAARLRVVPSGQDNLVST
jgi:hypothetical protein